MTYNRGLIQDPAGVAREHGAASWLFLCGEEVAAAAGGMAFAQVQAAVPDSANVVSDPPVRLTMDVAHQQIAALESLPQPALVTCRTGPRSSALIYLYAGLKSASSADEVLGQAEQDDALFTRSEELKDWVRQGLTELS